MRSPRNSAAIRSTSSSRIGRPSASGPLPAFSRADWRHDRKRKGRQARKAQFRHAFLKPSPMTRAWSDRRGGAQFLQCPISWDNPRTNESISDAVIVEVKSIERLERVHGAQLLSYLKQSTLKPGLLINFNVKWLHDGVKRVVNG